jgi:hypothetical protein
MPCIVTSVHDPLALAAACRRLNLAPPQWGCVGLGDQEVNGWIVRLPGVRFPVVCNTLAGLIAYHPIDNAFGRYARLMQFVQRYYAERHRLQQGAAQPQRRFVRIAVA